MIRISTMGALAGAGKPRASGDDPPLLGVGHLPPL